MSGLPFSVDWLPDGRTVLTSVEGVVTADADGTLTSYGATGQAWNEIVVDAHGNTFVNAVGFDLMRGEDPRRATSGSSVPTERRRGGRRRVVPQRDGGDDDGSTLIVAESYGHCLTAFDIAATAPDEPPGLGRPG